MAPDQRKSMSQTADLSSSEVIELSEPAFQVNKALAKGRPRPEYELIGETITGNELFSLADCKMRFFKFQRSLSACYSIQLRTERERGTE